jgi:transposase
MRGKKIWGRKRHLLVDTQGNLLAVKVTGAHQSDQQGAKTLLEPVKELFPKIKLLWGDSHYGGTLIGWLKEHLGWAVAIVRRLKAPERGLLVPRSAPRSTGSNSFLQAFVRFREDGSSSAALPGSPAGDVSVAITRDGLKAARPSSSSRPVAACSRSWLRPFPN